MNSILNAPGRGEKRPSKTSILQLGELKLPFDTKNLTEDLCKHLITRPQLTDEALDSEDSKFQIADLATMTAFVIPQSGDEASENEEDGGDSIEARPASTHLLEETKDVPTAERSKVIAPEVEVPVVEAPVEAPMVEPGNLNKSSPEAIAEDFSSARKDRKGKIFLLIGILLIFFGGGSYFALKQGPQPQQVSEPAVKSVPVSTISDIEQTEET